MTALHPDALLAFATESYRRAGLDTEAAALCADTLVQADLWGHQSHGMMRLPWYVARLRSGACQAAAVPRLVTDAGAIAVLDGEDGMGQVMAGFAVQEALRRAGAHGVGVVALRHSGHFGTAMYFTRQIAAAGCIGFLTTTASPSMAPWGGRAKKIGNNPWSWAAPVGQGRPPMVLDIANSGVARGKVYLAQKRGEAIPPGWALDAAGRPTTDPAAAIEGIILPMAGHKGSGIAVMMDVLAGVLPGGVFGSGVTGPYSAEGRSGAGQLMIALDISRFLPLEDFCARMQALAAELKAVPRAEGVAEIFHPGEIEARAEERQRRDGIELPDETRATLRLLAAELGQDGGLFG